MASSAEIKGRSGAMNASGKGSLVQFDQVLLFAVCALCVVGLVMVYSASSVAGLTKHADQFHFLKRQALAAGAGFAGIIVIVRMGYMRLRTVAYPLLGLSILLLLAVLIPGIGVEANGARRWIRLPGFNLQPSELAKLIVAIYLACSMSKKRDKIRFFSVGILPHCVITGFVALLIFIQRDLGGAAVLGIILVAMLFAGGAKLKHIFYLAAAIVPGVLWKIFTEAYRLNRIRAFLDPWKYRADEGYQITESMMAIGSGGLTGVGLGQGIHKMDYLPEIHTDFIFSHVGEELGLFGTTIISILFAIIVWRGLRAAINAPDAFGTYLAIALTIYLGFQSAGNMAVALGLIPTKGMTLPFISYGGTSLTVNLIATGILLSISEGRGGFLKPKQGSKQR